MIFKRTKAIPAPPTARRSKSKAPPLITGAASGASVNQQRGLEAEINVRCKFEARGYSTEKIHFQTPFGEVDLLLRHPRGHLVACEIKYLQSEQYLPQRVSPAQLKRLRRAWIWMLERHPGTQFFVCFQRPSGRLLVHPLESFFAV